MYLHKIFIENIAAIESLEIEMPFTQDGDPKPLIIVGENGTGKSILLSHIADAILNFQNNAFPNDEILIKKHFGTLNFKLTSGNNITTYKDYSIAYLGFEEGEQKYEYLETVGKVDGGNLKEKIPTLSLVASPNEDLYKQTTQTTPKNLKDVFLYGAYCYFPPNRFELPHWMLKDYNSNKTQIVHKQRFVGRLDKPFIIECSADVVKHWILDVFLDASVTIKNDGNGTQATKDIDFALFCNKTKTTIEQILSKIFKKEVKLGLNYRNHLHSRIKVDEEEKYHEGKVTNKEVIPSLDNLSTGQAVLFNMFCNILKYGESVKNDEGREVFNTNTTKIKGIVIIDEIDLHLHSDLQKDILPQLIKLFPKIQFIITTHSPLFLLGMEGLFGKDGFQIVEMPSGKTITTERFTEFEKAYDYFKETKTFIDDIKKDDKHFIVCEGKTDPIHLQKTAEVLGIDLDNIKFQPLGDEGGDSILQALLNNLAKIERYNKVIGIFDRDVKEILKTHETYENGIKDYGNNVYSFCIPEIDFKGTDGEVIKTDLEIEHYYPISIIKTTVDDRRLFLGYEFNNTGNSKTGEYWIEGGTCKNRKIKFNHIIDNKVYLGAEYNDNSIVEKKNCALSKNDFAEAIRDGKIKTSQEDFENFKPIFDLIEKIIKEAT